MFHIQYTKGLIPDRYSVAELVAELRSRKVKGDRFYKWEEGSTFIYFLGWGVTIFITHRERHGDKYMDVTYKVGNGTDLFLTSFVVNSYFGKKDVIRFIQQGFLKIMFDRIVIRDELQIGGKKISQLKEEGIWDIEDASCHQALRVKRISYTHSVPFENRGMFDGEWDLPVFIG